MTDRQTRIAWLAGIIDGEGYLGARFLLRRRPAKYRGKPGIQRQLICEAAVSNTNIKIIDGVCLVLDELGIKKRVLMSQRQTDRWKAQWRVSVIGINRVATLLTALHPYLVGKQDQAETLIRIAQYRAKTVFTHTRRMADDAWLLNQLGDLKSMTRRGPVPIPMAVSGAGPAGGKELVNA